MKLIIEPGRAARNYWGDLWRFRELLFILSWRDIAVRYKQTIIGAAWAFARPAMIVVGFLFFRRMAGASTNGVPDAVLVFAGALPWQFFSSAVSECASSVVGNANLISKVYFPRIIVPLAAVATSAADFFVSMILLVAMMLWYGYTPGWRFLYMPAIFALLFLLSFGFGVWLAALNVKYRDFRFIVPFIVQFGVFISPVGFSFQDVPSEWRLAYALNPLVGAIEWFRWAVIGEAYTLDWRAVAISVVAGVGALIGGVSYFRRVENGFADII